MVYIVVITSMVNLCISDKNTCLWSSLVSESVGYLLPSPSISNKKEKTSFHVIIPTNSSMTTYPYNTLNHYVESSWMAIGKLHYRKYYFKALGTIFKKMLYAEHCNIGQ